MNIQTIKHVSDCVPLYLPHSLYLKPNARFNISVSLPPTVTGKSISSFDAMENLRKMIAPDKFSVLRVTKSTLEVIRFDAEIEERLKLRNVLNRIDGGTMKLSGYTELAKVRASEEKNSFPKRHDWDSFFRDARDMDEKKAGERPDTIHISNLPIRWFCPRHQENDENVKPSESIFKRIFEKFGDVRMVDIPICDPYRKDMKSHITGMKTFSFDQNLYFEGYIQFSEYLGFVKTMDELRGMKLVRKDGDKNYGINIKVTFDTSKHLSDSNIKRRKIIREKLIAKENAKLEDERKEREALEAKKEKERQEKETKRQQEIEKQRQREDRRKEKELKKIREAEEQQLNSKIKSEEKKLLIAQRKLESIRLLESLFERVKLKQSTSKIEVKKERDDQCPNKRSTTKNSERKPFDLRNKLMKRVKTAQEEELERQKNRVKKVKTDSILGSALTTAKRSPSVNLISSDDSLLSDSNRKSRKTRRSDSDLSLDEPQSNDVEVTNPLAQPGTFPVFNPETGQWINVNLGMGLGMYPFAPFIPGMRPGYFPPQMMPYRGRGGFRTRNRGRGRGSFRGRSGNSSYDYTKGDYDGYKDDYDYKRKRRDYRQRSRSRKSSRSRTKSRSRNRHRRSRSRNHRSRSSSRSRSRSPSNAKKSKLVSTLRSRSSSPDSDWSKSRSRSKSRNRRSWSRRHSHRSSSHGKRVSQSPKSSSYRSSDRSKRTNRERKRNSEEIERKTNSPREHRSKSNNSRSPRRLLTESSGRSRSHSKSKEHHHSVNNSTAKSHRSRSNTVDSSKFQSPVRNKYSDTPVKEWNS